MTTPAKKDSGLFSNVPSLFADFFEDDLFGFDRSNEWVSKVPPANVMENEDNYVIEMAAPGMKKKDFQINIQNGNLTISAENETEEVKKEKTYTRKEYGYTSFSRSFRLPEIIDSDKILAKYENGILQLTLPKKAKEKIPVKKIAIS
ncbi:Hsp20/alpha crystallin family protein [Fulvivirgaceae bacterium BMA10]|uniref:Hsp20/alpha crystallin family protein n=1 Tax=Splendidivirga corallicola TaxID=3051826 RepID=A0ABT8KWA4_9BACT|nr:Hsp20/alpha crystallin family protein [Fulvivirgaceae bacterium BMA10]